MSMRNLFDSATDSAMENVNYLRNLNDAQLAAVTSVPTIPLQILAGPGSGKTRTLTCRIAHLIRHHKIPPSKIVAVTFTNKAANELRVRLESLIGNVDASLVVLGTFHAICCRLLRQHGKAIKLPRNFSICDSDESKRIINGILKDMVANLGLHGSAKRIDVRDSVAVELISKAKSKGLTPEELEAKAHHDIAAKTPVPKGENDPHFMLQLCSVYAEYVKVCKRNNALDFDDLLVFGVKLLKEEPSCIDYEHVFVDEFQDTNTTQLELMIQFAARSGNVSVVGDPDQSIYGWRSAEIENLNRMITLFPTTEQIYLEDNYRSTGAILAASIAIISEDATRPPKTLRTPHPRGVTVTLGSCADEHEEAACIAEEIKRLKVISGGLFKWSDFVILLRFNALSRNLEAALQKEGIPNRVLSGQKFFDRVEIKDLLAYLQLIDNSNFDPAALRVLNVPKRGIGDRSIEELRKRASKMGMPVMRVVEGIVDGHIPDISLPLKLKTKDFVETMRALRKKAIKGMRVAALIQELLTELKYADHLQKTQPDWESRWENVRELITFATEVAAPVPDTAVTGENADSTDFKSQVAATDEGIVVQKPTVNVETHSYFDDADSSPEDDSPSTDELEATSPLRLFLQTTSLSTDTAANDNDEKKEKVVISTCHAAKGLEWPVVFIPSVERGTFPFYRSENTDEERRLLYVACTRAQALLYLTYTKKRKLGGESRTADVSEFISVVLRKNRRLFTNDKPTLGHREFSILSKVLGRPAPGASVIDKSAQDYIKLQAPPSTTPIPRSSSDRTQQMSPQNTPTKKAFQFRPVSTLPPQPRSGPVPPAVFTTARSLGSSLPQFQNNPSLEHPRLATGTSRATPQAALTATDGTLLPKDPGLTSSRTYGLQEVPKNIPKPNPLSSQPGQPNASTFVMSSAFKPEIGPSSPVVGAAFPEQLLRSTDTLEPTSGPIAGPSMSVAPTDPSGISTPPYIGPPPKLAGFAPFSSFCVDKDAESTISDVFDDLTLQDPLLRRVGGLRLYPISRPLAEPSTSLSELCKDGHNLVSFALTPSLLGGKGGFGSQLRAAGGRMSSQRTSNNDSCRDLSGRRLSTVKEAKKLAAYLENEPERKKAALEAQKAKLAALDKQLGTKPEGGNESQPHAGIKRRLDDTEFLEESQNLVDNVKSAVVQGLLKKRKKARMDPPPAPSSSATTSHRVTEEKQIKVETIATGTQEVSVA